MDAKVAAKLLNLAQDSLLYSKILTITRFCCKILYDGSSLKFRLPKKGWENWKRLELLTIFAELVDTGPKQFLPFLVSDSCRYPAGGDKHYIKLLPTQA